MRPHRLLPLLVACTAPSDRAPAENTHDLPDGAGTRTASAEVRRAMAGLAGPRWPGVAGAADVLRAHRDEALPLLVLAVRREERIELEDTADLIFPGAPRFYGHGQVIPYDLDHLGDRAGWLLEELTFRDFGFRSPAFWPGGVEPDHDAAARRRGARAAAAAWWDDVEGREPCYDALARAVTDGAPTEMQAAYQWLRFGGWACPGFTEARLRADLLGVVEAHANAPDHPMQRQAELTLRERDDLGAARSPAR